MIFSHDAETKQACFDLHVPSKISSHSFVFEG